MASYVRRPMHGDRPCVVNELVILHVLFDRAAVQHRCKLGSGLDPIMQGLMIQQQLEGEMGLHGKEV